MGEWWCVCLWHSTTGGSSSYHGRAQGCFCCLRLESHHTLRGDKSVLGAQVQDARPVPAAECKGCFCLILEHCFCMLPEHRRHWKGGWFVFLHSSTGGSSSYHSRAQGGFCLFPERCRKWSGNLYVSDVLLQDTGGSSRES